MGSFSSSYNRGQKLDLSSLRHSHDLFYHLVNRLLFDLAATFRTVRYSDSIENVLNLAEGLMTVDVIGGEPVQFSESFSCPDCGISIEEIEPRSFSFNNTFGACPECFGLGYKMEFDEDLMIPDKRLSISEGAIAVMGWQSCTDKKSFTYAILDALSKEYDFSIRSMKQNIVNFFRIVFKWSVQRKIVFFA